ncbi:unnamed protein product [Prorocentrum cordatum]|uniref:Cytochrome f large domain-containing protein n=1 Tax=Prorocentrum cordatum TaxID=2364126 RepID=A0ABN9W1M0_9DINO|nr:unnamed protein product [Polarella glacialis]
MLAGLAAASAFVVPAPSGSVVSSAVPGRRFLAPEAAAPEQPASLGAGSVLAAAGVCAIAAGAAARAEHRRPRARAVVACRAAEPDTEALAKQVTASAAATMVAVSAAAAPASAYPIFAQQNYPNPREATGKIACANCHLQGKYIEVKMPHEVLPDTIFKTLIELPLKYEKRVQPIADGSKASLNAGAIAIMPEGWKLAPKDRLPKALKKQMKGLAWSPYSKDKPNIVVAGPVPGKIYETMVLPILAPDPNKTPEIVFNKYEFYFGGNRGRGQVYPEGNLSNVNMYTAAAEGTVTEIVPGEKVVITKADGTAVDSLIGKGATVVVEVGESVKKDEQITTNPNVGGFGQEDKEVTLQDMNRVYAYCGLSISIFLAQLVFVLKKKQFEKVQLAEGF